MSEVFEMDNFFAIYELKAIGVILEAMGTNENVTNVKDLDIGLNFLGNLITQRAEALEKNELQRCNKE